MDPYSDDAPSSPDSEDTAFYEELTRQILMLTDEDDDTCVADGVAELRRKPVVGVGSRPVSRNVNYYGWSEIGRSTSSVPGWMEGLWANSGVVGTGVFIPSGGGGGGAAAHAGGKKSGRRRYNNNNKGRKNNYRGRMYSGAAAQMIHG